MEVTSEDAARVCGCSVFTFQLDLGANTPASSFASLLLSHLSHLLPGPLSCLHLALYSSYGFSPLYPMPCPYPRVQVQEFGEKY